MNRRELLVGTAAVAAAAVAPMKVQPVAAFVADSIAEPWIFAGNVFFDPSVIKTKEGFWQTAPSDTPTDCVMGFPLEWTMADGR